MIRILLSILLLHCANASYADSYESDVSKKILDKISERYPDCEIEVRASDISYRDQVIDHITDARILDEIRAGVFLVKIEGLNEQGSKISALAEVTFSAWKNSTLA